MLVCHMERRGRGRPRAHASIRGEAGPPPAGCRGESMHGYGTLDGFGSSRQCPQIIMCSVDALGMLMAAA